MTRKRIRHGLVEGHNKRNNIFAKRSEGLLKKANELSILCGVDVAVVAHHRDGPNNAILWPSSKDVKARMDRFLECPTEERAKKMVTHEGFMEHVLKIETDVVDKARKVVEVKEGQQLLHSITSEGGRCSMELLNLTQLNRVNLYAQDMLKMLYKRKEELQRAGPLACRSQASTSVLMSADNNHFSLLSGVAAFGYNNPPLSSCCCYNIPIQEEPSSSYSEPPATPDDAILDEFITSSVDLFHL